MATPKKAKSSRPAPPTVVDYSHEDEAATRKRIDAQLWHAGWEANSKELTFASGARPQRGTNRAIAEWPTASGPADYVLFADLFERGETRHYDFVREHISLVVDLYDAEKYTGSRNYYTPKRPLTAENKLGPPVS